MYAQHPILLWAFERRSRGNSICQQVCADSLPSSKWRECMNLAILPLCHEAFILATNRHSFPAGEITRRAVLSHHALSRGSVSQPLCRDVQPWAYVTLHLHPQPTQRLCNGVRIPCSIFWKSEPLLNMHARTFDKRGIFDLGRCVFCLNTWSCLGELAWFSLSWGTEHTRVHVRLYPSWLFNAI